MNRKEIKKVRHSRMFLPGISLLYVVSQIGKILHLVNNKKAGDPRVLRTATPGMTALFNKGFTLIELLVVVLIIGILAAIALPQYQVAVLKTRYATVKNLVQSIANAERVFYMANGHYGYFDELDIDVGGTETSRILHNFPWGNCRLEGLDDEWTPKVQCDVNYKDGQLRYQENFANKIRKCGVVNLPDMTSAPHRVCQNETGRTVTGCSTYCEYYYD